MFRLVSLVCRRWQRTRQWCFAQQQLHYQLEPIARRNGTFTCNTSDTAGSPDVEMPQLLDDQRLRQRRTAAGGQKIVSDMTEMYRTRRRIKERFYKLMKTYELEGFCGRQLPNVAYELIKACASGMAMEDPATKVATANELFSELKTRGAPLDTSIFNLLLKVYVANDHSFTPSEFLEEMTADGVLPNQGTFNLLTEVYCNQGNLAGATNLIEHMKSLNLPVWEGVYANLITAHARCGDITNAEGVLEVMVENGHVPGIYSYTALLCAFAEKGDLAGIKRIYEEMQTRQLFPGVTTYIKVIDSLSKFNQPQLIPEILKLIRNKQWLIVDLRALACALAMRGEMEGSLQLIECLREIGGLSTSVGQCVVRGKIKNGSNLRDILAVINHFHDTKSDDQIQVVQLYQELLYSLHFGQMSMDDHCAEDIVTVTTTMQQAGLEIRMHYVYPALARYSQEGNIKGAVECLLLFRFLCRYSFNFLQRTLEKANISIEEFCQAHPGTERIVTMMVIYLIKQQKWSSAAKLAGTQMVSVDDILNCVSDTLSKYYATIAIIKTPSHAIEVVKLFKALSELESQPRLVDCIELMAKGLTLHSKHRDALAFLHEVEDIKSLEFPNSLYEVLLCGFNSASQADQFYEMLKIVEEKQVHLSVGAQKEILKMAGILRAGPLAAKAMRVLEEHDSCTWRDMSNFISAVAQENFLAALSMYKKMRSLGHIPTYLALEQLISASLMKAFHTSEDLLSDATSFGYTLRLNIKNDFIEQYSRRGDVLGAKAMVDRILSDGQTPSVRTYQKLMEGYAHYGDAEEICNLIEQKGLKMDRFMLSNLIKAYLKSNRYMKAMMVLDEYPGIVPLVKTLTQLLCTSLELGYHSNDIEKIRKAMEQLNFPQSAQCEIIFKFCCETGQLQGAWLEMQNQHFVLNETTFIALCEKLITERQTERIRKVLKMLEESGYHKNHQGGAATILAGYEILKHKGQQSE